MITLKQDNFIGGHLLSHLIKGKPYPVLDTYCRSRKILDETGKEVWISNKVFKKYFEEGRDE